MRHPPSCSDTAVWTAPISAPSSPSWLSLRTLLDRSRPGLASAGPGHHVLGAGAIRTAFRRPRLAADADGEILLGTKDHPKRSMPKLHRHQATRAAEVSISPLVALPRLKSAV